MKQDFSKRLSDLFVVISVFLSQSPSGARSPCHPTAHAVAMTNTCDPSLSWSSASSGMPAFGAWVLFAPFPDINSVSPALSSKQAYLPNMALTHWASSWVYRGDTVKMWSVLLKKKCASASSSRSGGPEYRHLGPKRSSQVPVYNVAATGHVTA